MSYENETKKVQDVQEENFVNKITDMLDLFYANKHLNERILRTGNEKK